GLAELTKKLPRAQRDDILLGAIAHAGVDIMQDAVEQASERVVFLPKNAVVRFAVLAGVEGLADPPLKAIERVKHPCEAVEQCCIADKRFKPRHEGVVVPGDLRA